MTRRHYHILENEWVFDVNLTCAVKVILTADSALTRTLLASFGKGIEFLSQTHIF